MENQKTIYGPLGVLRSSALLVIYSLLIFFYFHYSSHTSEGNSILFDVGLSTYVFYFIAGVIISVWMALSSSFTRQVLMAAGVLLVLDVIAWFVPFGFVPLGMALLIPLSFLFSLLIISLIVFHVTKPLENKPKLVSVISVSLFLLLVPVVYANYTDFVVKGVIVYKNNSMFDSIEECNAYLSPIRQNNCRKDWTAMHDRWDLDEKTKNINLNQTLNPVAGSDNYQYFPHENISDVRIGTGDVARYNDKAVVNVLSAVIEGKTYDNPSTPNNPTITNAFKNYKVALNTSVESYNSYVFGIIGMKVGGVRKITFKTSEGFWFTGVEPMILAPKDQDVTYTVELVSLEK